MSFSLRLIRLFAYSLLVGLIPVLLPIPNSPFPVSAQAQTTQNKKAEADRLLDQGVEQFNTSQFDAAIQSGQQALQLYRVIKDRQGEGWTLELLHKYFVV